MKKNLFLLSILTFLSGQAISAPLTENSALYNDHAKIFIKQFAEESNYTIDELNTLFSNVKIKTKAKKEAANQAEFTLYWNDYKNNLVSENRIKKGKEFLKNNKDIFDKIEKEYNVEREVIASIIGIESNYGSNLGNYRAIDALSTMAFEYYKKGDFYKNQLKSYLNRCKKEKTDCLLQKSSWAGAMGYGQFIPTSIDSFAVDYNKNGKIDVVNEVDDAIASVANYLNKHGWVKGDFIAKEVSVVDPRYKEALSSGLKLNTTVANLRYLNVQDIGNINGKKEVKIYEMKDKLKTNVWVGYNNFKAITHYNKSNFYASAVYLLSESLK